MVLVPIKLNLTSLKFIAPLASMQQWEGVYGGVGPLARHPPMMARPWDSDLDATMQDATIGIPVSIPKTTRLPSSHSSFDCLVHRTHVWLRGPLLLLPLCAGAGVAP